MFSLKQLFAQSAHEFVCPCCKENVKKLDHHLTCPSIIQIHSRYHDIIAQNIINAIPSKFGARKCLNERHDGSNEHSFLRPDILTTSDNQIFDVTIAVDKKKAFQDKVTKYKDSTFGT